MQSNRHYPAMRPLNLALPLLGIIAAFILAALIS